MSWLKRLFGSAIKSSGTFRQEPFGDGFLLQDSAGKWVAWVNELRNLERSEVHMFRGYAWPFKVPKMHFHSCGIPSGKPFFRLNTVATKYLSRAAYLWR